jgi:hypothetical protein
VGCGLHQLLQFLPGFTWLSWGSFFLSLVGRYSLMAECVAWSSRLCKISSTRDSAEGGRDVTRSLSTKTSGVPAGLLEIESGPVAAGSLIGLFFLLSNQVRSVRRSAIPAHPGAR